MKMVCFFIFSVNCSFVHCNTSAFWSVDKLVLEGSLVPHSPGLVVAVHLQEEHNFAQLCELCDSICIFTRNATKF